MFGKKANDPLGPPTWTTCVFTMPDVVLDDAVDRLPAAEEAAEARRDADDCAAAKPIRVDTMIDLEMYMLAAVLSFM